MVAGYHRGFRVDEEQIIDEIIEREGREYTDHPADRGGPTKFGITQATLSDWHGRPASVAEVRALTEPTARAIYRERYILKPGFSLITNARTRVFLIDSGVNHGPADPIGWLQQIVAVKLDGDLGPQTARAANNSLPKERLFERLVAKRIRHYGRLITDDPSQAVFAHGWMNRVARFLEQASSDLLSTDH